MLYSLQGKNVEEIERAVDKLKEVISKAIDRCVPKLRARTLPHHEIDQETRSMMEEAKRIKIQMVNRVDYMNNRRRLTVLRERIKEIGIEREIRCGGN